ncbi:carboxypeptidase-like regulatory domain-containing protein [Pontibacter harenae]|uniref:carboxypeptidase-like regulatory domain-containing protein n=1 Tax=Pontibacter harenae TaxID=2894083 RepID=UPI001E5A3EEF|nr:carboxypeptidase-like regulatory domain-containing protein [Pontibacter harenae]MCC9166135.1 carboxypeptidase-like regulatory domain-containing protein [Pontibacter harenae]
MKFLILVVAGYLFFPAALFSQGNELVLKGKVVDQAYYQAIPYASIGVKDKDVGTVTNEKGEFTLSVKQENAQDTLVLSMIGYKKRHYTVDALAQALRSSSILTLEAATLDLKEVEIAGNRLQTKSLGNEATPSGVGMTPFKFSNLGNEIGLLCKVKDQPTYLEEFHVDIFLNDYDTLFFRLNIYTLTDGLPDENIQHEPIYLKFTGKKGKASVDLKPYNLMVNEDFVVSLEYVKELRKIDMTRKEQSGLYFGAKKVFGGTVYTRSSSQGKWIVSKSGLFAPKMEIVVKS